MSMVVSVAEVQIERIALVVWVCGGEADETG
jgi:hypothetical protein